MAKPYTTVTGESLPPLLEQTACGWRIKNYLGSRDFNTTDPRPKVILVDEGGDNAALLTFVDNDLVGLMSVDDNGRSDFPVYLRPQIIFDLLRTLGYTDETLKTP